MDKRGLTVDPNRDVFAEPKWYDSLGSTRGPSPYATAAWQYVHKTLGTETIVTPEPVDPEEFDNGDSFLQNTYQVIWDAAENFSDPKTDINWDNGLYGDLLFGLVDDNPVVSIVSTTTFAAVRVYDDLASQPGTDLEVDVLLIDALDDAVLTLTPIDPNDLTVYDNGDAILDPVPDPNAIYDSGTFAQQGQGVPLDEQLYIFSNNPLLFRVYELAADPDDGLPLLINSLDPELDSLELDIGTFLYDAEPRGTLLGEINYEITGPLLTITDWSHYNWQNAQPVEKAFAVLLKDAPECVDVIAVNNAPTAFWRKLGFKHINKGSDTLIYDKSSQYVTTY